MNINNNIIESLFCVRKVQPRINAAYILKLVAKGWITPKLALYSNEKLLRWKNRKTKFQMQNRKHSTRHLCICLLSHIHALVVANLLFLSGEECMRIFCKKGRCVQK